MVFVKLQGGLGNQMFQYAAARSLSKSVFLNLDYLKKNSCDRLHFTARTFQLRIFKNLKNKSNFSLLFYKNKLLSRILKKIFKNNFVHVKQVANEFVMFPKPRHFKCFYLDGYFQSEKYFSHIKNELRYEFQFPKLDKENSETAELIRSLENSTSLHIRRGDYISSSVVNDVHGILPIAYYEQAINNLKLDFQIISIFVFSDDVEWAKAHLNFENCNFVCNNVTENSWKDMALMSFCKHHIIANSSFSWWGAWLSDRGGQKYAPANWFNPKKIKYNLDEIIPLGWNVINYD